MAAGSTVRCAVVGYGGAFNMGRAHGNWIQQANGLELVAACDTDPKRTRAAQEDFPHIETYNDVKEMLKKADLDLAVIILPHNLHADVAIQCLKAGKHVIVEKPMCITVREADRMIDAAQKSGVMLSVFHNRRWDGDFMALQQAVRKGLVGDVFHVEMFAGGYHAPGKWWRSDKLISGGAFYDWGAHFLDWLLNLIPERIAGVSGFFHPDLVWKDCSNEDNVEAVIRFESGAVAHVQMSSIAFAGKPRWKVLGTKGAIVDQGGAFTYYSEKDGVRVEGRIPYLESDWAAYYNNIADHLVRGKELIVKPEQARRVIAVMEYAERSSQRGQTLALPGE